MPNCVRGAGAISPGCSAYSACAQRTVAGLGRRLANVYRKAEGKSELNGSAESADGETK